MLKKENSSGFTIKEISVALNNALSTAMRPVSGEIGESRLRRLRAYSQALIAPLTEHLTGGVDEIEGPFEACLDPEELIVILLSSALYFHLTYVAKTDRVPQAGVVETLFKQE